MSCTITQAEVVALLARCRGATILSFVARTDARLKKTGCPYRGVEKVARVNVLVNFHYDAGVCRRLVKEGKSPEDFRQGSSWHTPVLGDNGELTPFCTHKSTGDLYLRVLFLQASQEIFVDDSGKELVRDEVAPWLPAEEGYANQGLDAPLVFKTYKLSGIKELTIDGQTYHVAA